VAQAETVLKRCLKFWETRTLPNPNRGYLSWERQDEPFSGYRYADAKAGGPKLSAAGFCLEGSECVVAVCSAVGKVAEWPRPTPSVRRAEQEAQGHPVVEPFTVSGFLLQNDSSDSD